MKQFVAYYRVSSKQQGTSGLGLEAQQASVLAYIRRNGNRIIAEFTEVESGGRDDRPELTQAINAAKQHSATLVIAKLDRLSRNVKFISELMDAKVKFVCCDMPDATELTIHIFAAMAQHERTMISERTKAALDAKREREPDWQPGTPANLTAAAKAKAHASISRKARESQSARHAYHFIAPRRAKGLSYAKIAAELNAEGYRTRTGLKFHAMSVRNIWKRFETETPTQL